MRVCKDCNIALDPSNNRKTSGRLCNKCVSRRVSAQQNSTPEKHAAKLQQMRDWYARNREERKAKNHERYLAVRDVWNAARREARKNWTPEEREIDRKRSRNYYLRNREVIIAKSAAYNRANPLRHQAYVNNYRTRPGEIVTESEWTARLEEFGHACAYCLRRDVELTQDHIHSLRNGGPHHIDNVIPACRSCNSKKNKHGILVMTRYLSEVA